MSGSPDTPRVIPDAAPADIRDHNATDAGCNPIPARAASRPRVRDDEAGNGASGLQAGRRTILAAAIAASAGAALLGGALAEGPAFDPNAPVELSPVLPADVDPAIRDHLMARGDLLLAHRLFERQQWQAFVALNWPVDGAGAPQPRLGDAGAPAWTRWIETYQVFKPGGADPDPWGAAGRSLPLADSVQEVLPSDAGPSAYPAVDSGNARVLHNLSSIGKVNVADEVDQAFSFAVFDQTGAAVHYESLINEVEYGFIVQNRLFEAGGIADYVAKEGGLTFPAGRFEGNVPGAIEIKLAWRILDPSRDDFGRYLTQPAYVISGPGEPAWKAVTAGLVGFHIAQKTETSPQWIWSTFEHVDNLATDRLTSITTEDGTKRPLTPSFNDPDCEWCPVNMPTEPGPDGLRRTQVQRLVPIPPETATLNRQMQAALAEAGSKLAYYEMIGVQWPTLPQEPPQAGAAFPGAVINTSGGVPLKAYLANSVMETFSQAGNMPANRQPRSVSTSDEMVFGTGSCIGCHGASPYDFSWIITKAQRRPGDR